MAERRTARSDYRCACGFQGTLDDVIQHIQRALREGDKRAYTEGGHAVMLRAMREAAERGRAQS